MPSSDAVTALTEQPPSARCLTVQNCGPRSSKTMPSTVPITIVFDRASFRCEFVPPLESRIIVPILRPKPLGPVLPRDSSAVYARHNHLQNQRDLQCHA